MATWNSPAVARRWLAHELRTRREALGLSQSAVGKACGWSGVKVSYIENAQQKSITDDDLDKLLPLLKVPSAERPAFSDAAAATAEQGWWERYGDEVVPPYLSEFIGLEQGASLIRTSEPTIIPGLLQIPDYMRATIGADLVARTDRAVRRIIEVRQGRQAVLTREDDPAELQAIVDESVLRRVVVSPEVMAAQLRRVLALCERPNVTLRVVPFVRGIIPGFGTGSFRILHFPGSTPPTVYLEAQGNARWIDDGNSVDLHDLAFEEMMSSALSIEDTMEMLVRTIAAYTDER